MSLSGHTAELEAEIKSPRYIAGMMFPYTGIVNPQKLRIIPARIYKWYAQRWGVTSH